MTGYQKIKTSITKNAKREIRRIQIIDAALKVLAEEGYSKFTLRNIADKAGFTLGAVQYYFSCKKVLLKALMNQQFQLGFLKVERARNKLHLSPEAEFLEFVNMLFQDYRKPQTLKLYFQLFALASTNTSAAEGFDNFYREVLKWLETLLRSLNPGLSNEEYTERAILILSMSKGMMQVIYRDKSNKSRLDSIENRVRNEILRIAKSK